MKSLAELAAIRDKMKDKVALREGHAGTRIVVGMATCGISAGARPVLNAFVEEVAKEGLAESVFASMNRWWRFLKATRRKSPISK